MGLSERDRQVIWHPFTRQKNGIPPIPVTRAKGSFLYDENGNAYIDAISSWWVTLHGHAHPYIAEKIYRQALELEQVIFAGFTHEPAVQLAERLLPLLPGRFSRVFYSDNGSTSTEVAMKMAIQYWWNRGDKRRKKILAFRNAYHGDTFGSMSVSDRSVFTLAFHDLLFEVIFIDTPTVENIAATCELIGQHQEEIAAFIYEPLVQGAGGMKMYAAEMLNQLLAYLKQRQIICIADEVMTGFGRTGRLFASEYMEQRPDIICLSKGLTGGTMALGVTACTDLIYQAYCSDDAYKTFFHGHSFTANPIACAAALASLDLLVQNQSLQTVSAIQKSNESFAETIQQGGYPIRSVRVLGTLLAFEIDQGADEYLNHIGSVLTQQSLAEGVYLRPLGNTVYIMPPYCITEQELQKVYGCIQKLLSGI
ncbi:adenosylmethionine--8-amino-7-oxononanoate transaminase [Sediminibacterium soli]|uniref:adenosylmethionine--8-amino-7-oxononanoate transaminase n=1 Tax=Sediminibacterium soli TaxID=2698829 RepID=UPI00137ABCC0|nr:adenosylmethionine--8-amino-7-oxononanoate transaminase [Sediminibacterium soli]NCI45970.1 adenosylmethionine--8-amino-7-oxononanoate transaminase [Sediminibacterium soli]